MDGVNRLANTIQERVQNMNATPPVLDFGTIQGDFSLLTNTFPLPIPQSDYMVCRSVAIGKPDDVLYKTRDTEPRNDVDYSGIPNTTHFHDVLIGEKIRQLQPGDRVLVAWVGDDPCVVDLILPASRIKK